VGVGVAHGGRDLRLGEVAPGLHFGGNETRDRLALVQVSPSWTRSSTTRPPVRGAIWTSSTSIVPETG
jgi:hypothetical protein